jgi:hypothetical protein
MFISLGKERQRHTKITERYENSESWICLFDPCKCVLPWISVTYRGYMVDVHLGEPGKLTWNPMFFKKKKGWNFSS